MLNRYLGGTTGLRCILLRGSDVRNVVRGVATRALIAASTAVCLCVVGCGGSSPSTPSSTPALNLACT